MKGPGSVSSSIVLHEEEYVNESFNNDFHTGEGRAQAEEGAAFLGVEVFELASSLVFCILICLLSCQSPDQFALLFPERSISF